MELATEFITRKNEEYKKKNIIKVKDIGRKGNIFFIREAWTFYTQSNLDKKVFIIERLRKEQKEGDSCARLYSALAPNVQGMFLLRIMPVHISIAMHTGRQASREIHMPQAAGHAQAEVMIGDGFVAEQAAEAEVTAAPGAVQEAGVGGRF